MNTNQIKQLKLFLKKQYESQTKLLTNYKVVTETSGKFIDHSYQEHLNNFIINLKHRKNEIHRSCQESMLLSSCFDTNKFTMFTLCKCGSRSFNKYFSILNINVVPPEESYFEKDKDIIIVLRNPIDRFYSGLLTTYYMVDNPVNPVTEEERPVSEVLQLHTLGYTAITLAVKKYMEKHNKLKNLYYISFDNINLYTNGIHENSHDIDIKAKISYLKTIIKPYDIYDKDIWYNEDNSYQYLLTNSKVYDLNKWKNF